MGGIYSVTGYANDDLGSYWQVRQKINSKTKTYRDGVKCGDVIALNSAIMDYYLQTEETAVGLTSELNQFVRGITKEGLIDEHVNWNIICTQKQHNQTLHFRDLFKLKHSKTGKFLTFDKSFVYHQGNCGMGCIIAGQLEPHALQSAEGDLSVFQIVAGMNYQ